MSVYMVYGWDAMASSMGASYLDGVYSTREAAEARAQEMNDTDRECWMATASAAGKLNYRDNAHVVECQVKGEASE